LVQVLPGLLQRFEIEAKFYTVLDLQQEMYPALQMSQQYAGQDARHLAKLYDLEAPLLPSIEDRNLLEQASARLVAAEGRTDYLALAAVMFKQVWHGESKLNTEKKYTADKYSAQRLQQNQQRLKDQGHYYAAMIYCEGEWYWGLDRLDHLEQRLISRGLAKHAAETVQFNRSYINFCSTQPVIKNKREVKPLIIYWSARSPYSYIGLERAVKLAEHYKIPLQIKPVLPMMMREMYVPPVKAMYIFLDTKREAEKLGLPYGFVADPLGVAVERCYALLTYAEAENKLQPYLLSFARGVNAEGIRADTDAGLEKIVQRCGLDWRKAKAYISDSSWRPVVEENLRAMFDQGCWGVPSFSYGEHSFWGQDRLGLIEQAVLAEMT